ncbi:hypothetical protein T10_10336 [Trichinella papuae]|uniref:Uncharacterized protein n=1 Tax=Trichinella papuae TaxID=268474 RepID=A0A0V1MJP8_9BILA|nr:hypothetical protein T10_10336 [Trichinella papuae]
MSELDFSLPPSLSTYAVQQEDKQVQNSVPSARREHNQMENGERSTVNLRSLLADKAVHGQALVKVLSTTGRGGKFPILTNGSEISIALMINPALVQQPDVQWNRKIASQFYKHTNCIERQGRRCGSLATIPEEQKKKKKKKGKSPATEHQRTLFFVTQLSGEESFRRSVAKVKKGSPMTLGIGGIETKKKSRGQRFHNERSGRWQPPFDDEHHKSTGSRAPREVTKPTECSNEKLYNEPSAYEMEKNNLNACNDDNNNNSKAEAYDKAPWS